MVRLLDGAADCPLRPAPAVRRHPIPAKQQPTRPYKVAPPASRPTRARALDRAFPPARVSMALRAVIHNHLSISGKGLVPDSTQHTLNNSTTAACIIDASMTPLIVPVRLALQFGQP